VTFPNFRLKQSARRLSHACVALPLALAVALPGCCLTPPEPAELLELGFRSPEQAFRTFQVSVRADSARYEYRCFSSGFRARVGLSQLAYREVREKEFSPLLRKGVADAEIREREEYGPRAVRFTCSSHGYWFEVLLVREDYYQVWDGNELVHGEEIERLADVLGEEAREEGGRDLFAIASIPPGTDRATISELRVGSEWKIEDVRELETPASVPEN